MRQAAQAVLKTARRLGAGVRVVRLPPVSIPCRRSSVAELRSLKPTVGGSSPLGGTLQMWKANPQGGELVSKAKRRASAGVRVVRLPPV